MTLSDQHRDDLGRFLARARQQITGELARGGRGTLATIRLHEDRQGVWSSVTIDLHGEVVARWGSATYQRRSLLIRRDGAPVDELTFAADLLTTTIVEDLDTCGRQST